MYYVTLTDIFIRLLQIFQIFIFYFPSLNLLLWIVLIIFVIGVREEEKQMKRILKRYNTYAKKLEKAYPNEEKTP